MYIWTPFFSSKTRISVQYIVKMLSSSAETIIFIYIGLSTVAHEHNWSTWFVIATLFSCIIYRAACENVLWEQLCAISELLAVLLLTYFVNWNRMIPYTWIDQFIMGFGGLRGAIAYGLIAGRNLKKRHEKSERKPSSIKWERGAREEYAFDCYNRCYSLHCLCAGKKWFILLRKVYKWLSGHKHQAAGALL